MKPTTLFNETRNGPPMPKIDFGFQVGSMPSRGRGYDSRGASIRSISREYFKSEARSIFTTEAAFFSVIVMTAAVPLIHTVTAMAHLVRSFAAL
ncbi:MAG TPA: hypothetical protein VE086_10360 [Chthoniobacterales bacterium]|jgi:hypothetical protein|nr:hypothetical protein [Chthoniobacterales bacterium]